MNTYICDKNLIPLILDLGWIVKNKTWSNIPCSIYKQLKKEKNNGNKNRK
jgi:hypothetical protein